MCDHLYLVKTLLLGYMEQQTVTNPAVVHGLCAMTKQQHIARSGLPHDDDIILLV